MKNYIYTIALSILTTFCFAQGGSILSLDITPTSPTDLDTVYLIANLAFNSSDCPLDNKGFTIVADTHIQANTHHCIGLASAICNTSDTFKIGVLSKGDYRFSTTLTSGGAPVPCTPGIVADDMDTLVFNVTSAVSINDKELTDFSFYPNPANNQIYFTQPLANELSISNIGGKQIMKIAKGSRNADLYILATGVYFIGNGSGYKKLLID